MKTLQDLQKEFEHYREATKQASKELLKNKTIPNFEKWRGLKYKRNEALALIQNWKRYKII